MNVGCERRWSFKYIWGLPDAGSASADSGKRFHAYLEHWLKDGVTPGNADREARMASAALKYLPAPSKDLRVEEAFEFELEGVRFRGFKDLVYYNDATLVVHDHKSTSDLKWAKTADDLKRDTQAILYARHAFQEADLVDLSWLYVTRDKYPKVQPVRVSIDWDTVQKAMEPIIRTGKRVLNEYNIRREANALPANLDMCDAYGGCPYREHCHITAADRAKARLRQHRNEEDKAMGFRERIAAAQTTLMVQAPAPETATVTVPAPDNKPTMRERLATSGFGDAINPPPGPEPLAAPAVAPAEAPKRGRGRPKKVETPTEVTQEASPPAPPASSPTMPSPSSPGFTLCVNCLPYNRSFTAFTDVLRDILPSLCAANDVPDYRMVDFGKGAGMLSAALYSHLETAGLAGYLVVDARTAEGRDCLPTLERFAAQVIRGF